MNIKCIIVDDEVNNIENLQLLLEKYYAGISVVATATSAGEAIEKITVLQPDLVFLDIQMPVKSGFEVLKAFPKVSFEVIFVTAYDK